MPVKPYQRTLSQAPAGPIDASDRCSTLATSEQETSTEQLIARVEATRFDPNNPPPVEQWVFKLADVECLHAGNIAAVVAAVKSGKSSTLAAMIGGLIGEPDRDYLGFTANPAVTGTVLVFDTEQSRGDHFRLMSSVLNRAGLKQMPSRLASYSLLLESAPDRLRAIYHMARKAAAEPGGLAAIFIDGVADTALNVNDPEEATAIVDTLHKVATETRCAIITALHLNPGSEKSRGHLGSQIERKAETVFNLRKQEEIISIICKPARRQEITADKAPRFAWSTEAGMHLLTRSKAATADDRKTKELIDLCSDVFGADTTLRWKEIADRILETRGCAKSTMEKRIKEMTHFGVIRSAGGGLYMKGNQ